MNLYCNLLMDTKKQWLELKDPFLVKTKGPPLNFFILIGLLV